MNQARAAYDKWLARGNRGAAQVCERLGGFRVRTSDALWYEFPDGSRMVLGSGRYNPSAVFVTG